MRRWHELTQEQLVEAASQKAGNRRKLAKAVGVDHDYLYRYATGRAGMKFETTIALLAYLGWLDAASLPAPAVSDQRVAAARAIDEAVVVLERLAVALRGQADPLANAN